MLYTYLIKLLLNAVGIFITAKILDGVKIDGFGRALTAAFILSLANFFVKPVLTFLLYPITILTFGLFSFVINAIIILIVSAVYPHFKVKSFLWAMLFSIILSIINALLHWFFIV